MSYDGAGRGLILSRFSGTMLKEVSSMSQLSRLVVGRKSGVPLDELEAEFLVWIQRILDQGDHNSADKILLYNAVLLVRECVDLRKKAEPITVLDPTTGEFKKW